MKDKRMLSKNFYTEFGKVVYAMAMADGEIQEEERAVLYKTVREELAPLENLTDEFGTDLAFYTLFSFEQEDEIAHDTVEDAFSYFIDYLHLRNFKMTTKARNACINILKRMASSYGRTTKKEEALIDKLELEMDKFIREHQ